MEALRYARAVAETNSFSAAARAYGVTQPALSNGIARLEERLGERLFERSPRGVVPTAFGAHILPFVARALAAVDEISSEAARWSRPHEDQIRMGISPLIDPGLVSRAYAAVRELPGAASARQLVLREANVAELRASLLKSALDLILIPSVAPMPRYEHRIVDSEPMVVVQPQLLAVDPIELDELTGELILMPDTCGLTTFTRDLFRANELPVRAYAGEASSYRMLEEWANLGLGSAVIPKSKLTAPDARHRPLVERGVEVEIFYEAVWDASSPVAADLDALSRSLLEKSTGV